MWEKETIFKDDSGVCLYLFFLFLMMKRRQWQVLNFRCQDKEEEEERKELLQKEMVRIEKLFVFRPIVIM